MKRIADAERSLVDKCLRKKLIAPMKNCIELIRHLASLRDERLPQVDERSLNVGMRAMFQKLEIELDRIATEMTDSQTMAFQFDLIGDVYQKRIVQMREFVFHKKSKVVFDMNSSGTISFDIILPFKDTEQKDVRWPFCVSYFQLPDFFFIPILDSKISQSKPTPVSDEPTGTAEPTESIEPTEPTETAEPTEPIESTEPTEPTE